MKTYSVATRELFWHLL